MPPSRGRIDRAALPENGNHFSQDLIVPEGAILVGKRIAAGDETIAAFGDEPVRYKPVVAIAQDDLPGKHLRSAFPAHRQDIAGPYGGEHAGSGNLQAHFSELASNLRD
jgi:hypothetical protein